MSSPRQQPAVARGDARAGLGRPAVPARPAHPRPLGAGPRVQRPHRRADEDHRHRPGQVALGVAAARHRQAPGPDHRAQQAGQAERRPSGTSCAGTPPPGMDLVGPLAAWLGPWAGGIADHHERYDGTGYPQGLGGEQISLAGRIVVRRRQLRDDDRRPLLQASDGGGRRTRRAGPLRRHALRPGRGPRLPRGRAPADPLRHRPGVLPGPPAVPHPRPGGRARPAHRRRRRRPPRWRPG